MQVNTITVQNKKLNDKFRPKSLNLIKYNEEGMVISLADMITQIISNNRNKEDNLK